MVGGVGQNGVVRKFRNKLGRNRFHRTEWNTDGWCALPHMRTFNACIMMMARVPLRGGRRRRRAPMCSLVRCGAAAWSASNALRSSSSSSSSSCAHAQAQRPIMSAAGQQCHRPGWVALAGIVTGVLGYQYGNKRLRSLTAAHADEQKRAQAARDEAAAQRVATLEAQVADLQTQLDASRGLVRIQVDESISHAEVPVGGSDDSFFADWLDVAQGGGEGANGGHAPPPAASADAKAKKH